MSYYIARTAPTFENWQFKKLNEVISLEEWKQTIEKLGNLSKGEEENRWNLESIQNKEFKIHFFYNNQNGNTISFPYFPDRHMGEIVKYLFHICQELEANIYTLNNDGQTADKFDFERYKKDIEKEYHPLTEKQYTTLEVNELIGLLSISTTSIDDVVEQLSLEIAKVDTWENAVRECYDSKSILVRQIEDWVIVIGKPENLVDANSASEQSELLRSLMEKLSSRFGKVGYHFNASKYSYFEQYQFKDGVLSYKYIHGDGDEDITGENSYEYFDDFLALTFDKSILNGVTIYKNPDR